MLELFLNQKDTDVAVALMSDLRIAPAPAKIRFDSIELCSAKTAVLDSVHRDLLTESLVQHSEAFALGIGR